MKKKPLITTICVAVLCIAMVRVFTPYLGKPFLIYCDNDKSRSLHLSNKVKKIELLSAREPCIKFIRSCTELEEIEVINTSKKETVNISDISNPNLKRLSIAGKCVNWSSLNKCTGLKYLHAYESDFTSIEDISKLEKLETLEIINSTELSLSKLNELKNLKELSLIGLDEIDCEEFSKLDKLETLYLGANESMSSRFTRLKNPNQLNEMDSVISLTLVHPDQEIGKDICDMDSLKELTVFDTKFPAEIEQALEDKGVTLEYKE